MQRVATNCADNAVVHRAEKKKIFRDGKGVSPRDSGNALSREKNTERRNLRYSLVTARFNGFLKSIVIITKLSNYSKLILKISDEKFEKNNKSGRTQTGR